MREQFEDARRRYEEVSERSPFPYLVLDADGRILETNAAAGALLGADRESLRAKPFTAFMPAFDAERFLDLCRDVLHDRVRRSGIVAVQGRDRAVRINAITRGGARACCCVLFDVRDSDAAWLVKRLRASEERFRLITEHVEDVLYIVEPDDTLAYLSPAYDRIWKMPSSELRGHVGAWPNAVHEDDARGVAEAWASMRRGDPFDVEYRIVDGAGITRWIRDRAVAIDDGDGRVPRIVGIAHDRTAERELDLELRQLQKLETIGTLASGIAHDYNNVLQLIVSCASVAVDARTTPERAKQMMRRARDVALRGGQLVHQLSGFARKSDAKKQPLVLDRVITKTAPLLRAIVGEHIRVVVHARATNACVLATQTEIEQILLNLTSNARDAMNGGGVLTIATEMARDGERVRVAVADTGCGMDDATRARIFEPFFTTKTEARGTGLGLATVLSVARQLGGDVTAESELGKGTTFVVELPRVEPPKTACEDTPHAIRLEGRALVVEDEPLVRGALCRQLAYLGLEVFAAADGAQALELFQVRRPHVVITDVLMPGMTGATLAARLRARSPDLPVLFISGDPGGAVDPDDLPPRTRFLSKPFTADNLAAELELLLPSLARAPASAPSDATILLVEDDATSKNVLATMLTDAGFRVLAAATFDEAIAAAKERIDVLLTDLHLADRRGDDLAAQILRSTPDLRVVYMTGEPSPETAVPGCVVPKPIDFASLLDVIRPAREERAPPPPPPVLTATIRRRQANGNVRELVIRASSSKSIAQRVAGALYSAARERGKGVWSAADPELWVGDTLVGKLPPRGNVAELAEEIVAHFEGTPVTRARNRAVTTRP